MGGKGVHRDFALGGVGNIGLDLGDMGRGSRVGALGPILNKDFCYTEIT